MITHDDPSFDCIDVEGLTLRAVIGIFDFERDRKQDVLVSFRVFTDTSEAAAHDDIERALDYKRLTKRVIALVEDSSFFLVETLAERVAECILSDPRAIKVQVRLEKPGALRHARTVAVTITRPRPEVR